MVRIVSNLVRRTYLINDRILNNMCANKRDYKHNILLEI